MDESAVGAQILGQSFSAGNDAKIISIYVNKNVITNHGLSPANDRNQICTRPEIFSDKVPIALRIHACQMNCALALDKDSHLTHCM